jgi:hypothetical protein
MKRLKTIIIFSIEIILIFCCMAVPSFGINSTDNKSAQSGENLNTEVSNVDYTYYKYFFGLNSYGNTVITRYGKLPVLETEDQKESWNSTLEELSNKIKNTLASKYMYPHGEVMACGTNAKGYFVILFKYGNVDEPLMNEIYTLIDNSAKEKGIHDIPIEFGYGIYQVEIPLNKEFYPTYHTYGERTENLSESEIQAIEEYMRGKPEQLRDGNIANYGKIPLLKNKKELETWGNKLVSIQDGTMGKFSPYFDKNQVVAYGIGLTRLDVTIYENISSAEKTAIVKEIYQIIDEEARKQNVTDVPVSFKESELYHTSEEVTEDGNEVEETANLSVPEEEIISDNGGKPSKTNSTPCFSLLGGLTCLYGGWKLRKK